MLEFKKRLTSLSHDVDQWLSHCLDEKVLPLGLREAMYYSLLAGGKRIRPILCLVSAGLFGLAHERVLPFAGAIECIHTYSLIHDDLPAMDDDDLRRGRPSSHKRFNEATAILAGDALLTEAFGFMASQNHFAPASLLTALRFVAEAAGASGMVGGQFLDMQYTQLSEIELEALAEMHAMKTGALLRASCLAGAVLGGALQQELDCLARYAAALGAAFQITDDILDLTATEEELGKPIGRDLAMHKITYPSLCGLEKSKAIARQKINLALEAVQDFTGDDAAFLRDLARYILARSA